MVTATQQSHARLHTEEFESQRNVSRTIYEVRLHTFPEHITHTTPGHEESFITQRGAIPSLLSNARSELY